MTPHRAAADQHPHPLDGAGCSDKTARSWAQREEAAAAAPVRAWAGQLQSKSSSLGSALLTCSSMCLQKVTTAARASAALEAYWAARAAAGGPLAGDRLPGGERSSAHKTREACEWSQCARWAYSLLQTSSRAAPHCCMRVLQAGATACTWSTTWPQAAPPPRGRARQPTSKRRSASGERALAGRAPVLAVHA